MARDMFLLYYRYGNLPSSKEHVKTTMVTNVLFIICNVEVCAHAMKCGSEIGNREDVSTTYILYF